MSAIVAAAGMLSPETQAWVVQATTLSGRGGHEGEAVRVVDGCGLGHALLRTSPSEGTQPITLDGRIWITADVRLDDRRGLVPLLRSYGCDVTAGLADAQMVLHAYTVWGDSCLEHLEGDFAFAVWDGPRRRLLCARDQMGVAPLHYARIAGGLLVATSLDALLLHPEVSDDLDDEALADFLILGRHSDLGATAFEGIRRVAPAHTLAWSNGAVQSRRYWRVPEWVPLVRFRRAEEYVEGFRDRLDDAVADRITGDRVAVQLSGGMDSTSVAASARVTLRARGEPAGALRAVTAVLGGTSGDREGEYAALVAEELDVAVDWIDGASLAPLDPEATPLLLTPEPTPYQRTAYVYETARVPSCHAPVVLSGLGGDVLLWSSPWYWAEWLTHGQAVRLARVAYDQGRIHHERLHSHLRGGWGYIGARRHSGRRPIPGWLNPDFADRSRVAERGWVLTPRASERDARSLACDPTWSTWFAWGHPSFTGLPVKFRYPLADLRLLRFTLGLAPEPWLINKRILRDAAHDRLPDKVRRRPKTPLVGAPLPGHTQAHMKHLAGFVHHAPGLDRFVDREALEAALTATGAGAGHESDLELSLPLGLAYWLVHRRRPRLEPSPSKKPNLDV